MMVTELGLLLTDRSAAGIARGVARLVSAGTLAPGQRLPTVRALANELGVSPTTVSTAWQALQRQGVLETRGRLGSTILGTPRAPTPTRFLRLHRDPGGRTLDLSAGTPDPALLPNLQRAVRNVGRQVPVSSYFDRAVLPELEEVLLADWPFPAGALTIVDGTLDAIDRILSVTLRFGDRVIVENPTFPPILDLLECYGTEVIGLPVDEEGLCVPPLTEALASGTVAAIILQARAHNPNGHAMSTARAHQIAEVLPSSTLVIEDDHAAALSAAPPVSVGEHRPDQTVHIRGYSKSHGPDLRLAAMGGAPDVVDQVVRRRLLGPAWTSRLLQSILLFLLTDPASQTKVACAAHAYATRRELLAEALAERGVCVSGTDGINMWLQVHDEQAALIRLAVDQITAAPGSPFLSTPLLTQHIRITCATIADGYGQLADRIAPATRPYPRLHRAL